MSGMPAARLGDGTALGGPIVQGSSGVMIGAPNGKACSVCPGGMAVGNPVNPMLGAKVLQNEVDVGLNGSLNFIVSRSYSSYQTATPSVVGIFGPGWKTQTDLSLTVTEKQIILHDAAGRSLYFDPLLEGGIGYSQSESVWIIRGGSEKLAVKNHGLTKLWESIPLEIRMDRDYYFFTNQLLGPVAVLGYVTPFIPDNQKYLPQPLTPSRVLLMECDRFGQVIRYDRYADSDLKGFIYRVTDGGGRIYRLEYEALFKKNVNQAPHFKYGDDSGIRLKAVYLTHDPIYKTVPEHPLARYEYTKQGELQLVYDQANESIRHFYYDENYLGRMIAHGYQGRPVTNYEYDLDGRVIEQRNPSGLNYTFEYEKNSAVVKDSLGRSEQYLFEGEGGLKRVVKHIRKDGSFTENKFDQYGRMIAQTDALGRVTEFELNVGSGLLTKTITHDGREYQFNYNKHGQLSEMTSPHGQKSRTQFDDLGRMIAQTNGLKETTQYHYYENSDRIEKIIDPTGKEKTIEWTHYNQVKTFTDCSNKSTKYTYDQWGNITKVEHEEELFEMYQYNVQNQLVSSQNQLEETTEYFYNSAGDVTQVVLPNQQKRLIEYSPWGLVIAQTFGGLTQKFQYDPAARLIALNNENGASMSFDYDVMDRLTKEVGFDGRTKQFEYDALGRVIEGSDQSLLSQYFYDDEDRLDKRLLKNHDQIKEIQMVYGDYGLTQSYFIENNESIGVDYRYDPLGRMVGETQWVKDIESDETLWHHEITHQYNKLGLRETTELQGLPEIYYQTYGSGHLIGVMMGKQSLVDFERDSLHRETMRSFGHLTLQSAYGKRGELVETKAKELNFQNLNRSYEYDKVGQLTTILTAQGEINYHYDLSGRLTEAQSGSYDKKYEYDKAGNILPKGISALYSIFDDNKVIEDDKHHYSYDTFGNLIEKKVKNSYEVHRYHYDLEHRLSHYEYHNVEENIQKRGDYRYDPFGRRIQKITEDQTIWYGWDGDRLVTTETGDSRVNTIYHPSGFAPLIRIEQTLPLTEKVLNLGQVMEAELGMSLPKLLTDAFNEVEPLLRTNKPLSQSQQIWLEGMQLTEESLKEFLPEIPKQHPMQIHYYHTDQIGTPLALISNTGEIDWSLELDPFGNPVTDNKHTKIDQPIRMQGQQYDEESGLHYNRYRYYDPSLGRYISQDPIGLEGGMNNYIYPLNPNQWIDPMGLRIGYGARNLRQAQALGRNYSMYQSAQRVQSFINNGGHLNLGVKYGGDLIDNFKGNVDHFREYMDFFDKHMNNGEIRYEYGALEEIYRNSTNCKGLNNLSVWSCSSETYRDCTTLEIWGQKYNKQNKCTDYQNFLYVGKNPPNYLQGDGFKYSCRKEEK